MPSDLAEQIPFVHQACEALGVQVLTYAGFEADDVIGTLAMRAVAGWPAGRHRDGRQGLLSAGQRRDSNVRVFNPRDEGTWYDAEGVKEKFGVAPEQVVDVLALMGDSIDNIKGVPGHRREGRARSDFDTRLARCAAGKCSDASRGKKRELLTTHADSARESRVLLRIRTDVPLPDVDMSVSTIEGRTVRSASSCSRRSASARSSPSSLRPRTPSTATTPSSQLRTLSTTLISELERAGRFALSVIGDCPGGMRASLVGIAFSTGARRARYLPIGHTALDEPSALNPKAALAALKPLLENPSIAKIGHDLKFDLMMLAHEGIALEGLEFDTMLASYVLDATRSSHTIEEIALEHLGYKALTQEDICGTGQKAIPLPQLPAGRAAEFRGRACRSGVAARRQARRAASRRGLETLFRDLELPLIPVLADIEAPRRAHRPAGARQPVHAHRRRARVAQRERSSSSPARSSTSIRRSSSR